jgi:hypothetical protein
MEKLRTQVNAQKAKANVMENLEASLENERKAKEWDLQLKTESQNQLLRNQTVTQTALQIGIASDKNEDVSATRKL